VYFHHLFRMFLISDTNHTMYRFIMFIKGTHKHADTRTLQLLDQIGPVGRFGKNLWLKIRQSWPKFGFQLPKNMVLELLYRTSLLVPGGLYNLSGRGGHSALCEKKAFIFQLGLRAKASLWVKSSFSSTGIKISS
jgi:hypothetical protein